MSKRHPTAAQLFSHAATDRVHHLPGSGLRASLAKALRWLARRLRQAAQRLASQANTRRPHATELEFYAEAGAPEGALYVNGELVGHLPRVTRL